MTQPLLVDAGPLVALLSVRDRPMSLADACLVRMAELYDEAAVLTLDSDFTIYRKNGGQVIPLIAPFA